MLVQEHKISLNKVALTKFNTYSRPTRAPRFEHSLLFGLLFCLFPVEGEWYRNSIRPYKLLLKYK